MWEVDFVRGGIMVFSLKVVDIWFLDTWMSVGQLCEQLRNGNGLFPDGLS